MHKNLHTHTHTLLFMHVLELVFFRCLLFEIFSPYPQQTSTYIDIRFCLYLESHVIRALAQIFLLHACTPRVFLLFFFFILDKKLRALFVFCFCFVIYMCSSLYLSLSLFLLSFACTSEPPTLVYMHAYIYALEQES